MASRFVSGGKIDADTGEHVTNQTDGGSAPSSTGAGNNAGGSSGRPNAQWEAVQKELDAERRRREEARVKAVEGGEQSLYDILQANKAAKQAAFEEQNRIKNQFRPLDDDEIEFLDDVKQRRRQEEEKVRRETTEGLRAFREAQKLQERRQSDDVEGSKLEEGEGEVNEVGGGDEWKGAGRKRKRHEKEIKGIVRRKGSGRVEEAGGKEGAKDSSKEGKQDEKSSVVVEDKEVSKAVPVPVGVSTNTSPPAPAPRPKPGLGLVGYGSGDDDSD